MPKPSFLLFLLLVSVASSGCSRNEFAHTTAVIQVEAPPTQVLTVISKPVPKSSVTMTVDPTADSRKPFIIFDLENGRTFRSGEEVPIRFSVQNAKLKSDGGDFRIRYIVDDEEMKWLDSAEPFWLSGWTPGKHTFRIELVGPDGWPYKNGNANIVTREFQFEK